MSKKDWLPVTFGMMADVMMGGDAGYSERKVALTEPEENRGVGVSTVWTDDEGWETALLDSKGVHPVERYKTKKASIAGHKKWVKLAPSLLKIQKLYWGNRKEEYKLKPIR